MSGPFNHGRFGSHWDADPWLFVAGTFVVLVATIVWAIRARRGGEWPIDILGTC